MKKIITVILVLFIAELLNAQTPDSWTEKNGLGLAAPASAYISPREGAASFVIGNKGYMGTGSGTSSYQCKDFWEFDPLTNIWTQKANFAGTARKNAVGFSIGTKGYIGTGRDSTFAFTKDFWEYDPASNSWVQKSIFPGKGRQNAVGFTINNLGYIGTGDTAQNGSPYLKDFWEYNPVTNGWVQKIDFPGTGRYGAAGFSIGSKGYVGTGSTASTTYVTDFWEYNPATGLWTQKAAFAGTARCLSVSFNIGSKGYIGTGINVNFPGSFLNDFWEYDPASDTWSQKSNFGGIARYRATGFSIGTKGYIGTGIRYYSENDFWEYNQATDLWVQQSDYGATSREFASAFSIGNKGYFGTGEDYDKLYDDFWEYDMLTGAWTQKANFGGGLRVYAVSFSIGNRGYMGIGHGGVNNGGYKNDFWEYNPATNVWIQKANFTGTPRTAATGFSIGDKGYIGTGSFGGNPYKKDFWEYDQSSDSWSQKADFSGTSRQFAAGFSIGNKGYIGTGFDSAGYKGDFWEYSPATNSWIQKSNFAGGPRYVTFSFSVGNKGYIGAGSNSPFKKDLWEYDPAADSWFQRANFGGGVRIYTPGFSIGEKGFVCGGHAINCLVNDFWQYTPICSSPVSTIYASGNSSFCSGDSVFLFANNGYSYQWKKNGINISGATSYYYYAKTTGSYTCNLTNSCGAVTSSPISVTVNALPSATITPAGPTTFCSGGNVVLNAATGANRSYQWKKNGNLISGATLSSYTATSGGNYKVIVTNTVTGCSKTTSTPTVVTVNALPAATITPQGPTTFCAGGSVILQANTGPGFTYKWKKSGSFISGATLSNYTATAAGNYKVEITNSNGCSKLSAAVTVTVPCKLDGSEIVNSFEVMVYPNPNNGAFSISFSNELYSPVHIELTDELGRVVKRFTTYNETVVIKESNLARGIYSLTVRHKDEMLIKKISVVN